MQVCFFQSVFTEAGGHRSLSDNKSPQVSRTLISILADLISAVVWIEWILPLISNSSSVFSRHLRSFSRAQTTISVTVTLVFHTFFSSPARSKHLFSFHFISFFPHGLQERQNLLNEKFFSSSFFRRFAVTQPPVRKHRLMFVRKTWKGVNNKDNDNNDYYYYSLEFSTSA